MGALSHVLEAAGLSTVALLPSSDIAERMFVPRVLVTRFPLGRPLGKPGDAPFQRSVLTAALALLDRIKGPVLEIHPVVIEDQAADAAACPLPPRLDPNLPPAVDEARGLGRAVGRALATATGVSAAALDEVEDFLLAFGRLANGTPWREAGLPADILRAARTILSYYELAAIGLSEHVPAARTAETWYAQHTEAGRVMRAARDALRAQAAPPDFALYLLPATQA